jgi:hypothetical protein
MPDRSKVMTQTKRDTLVLQVGGWAWRYKPHPLKALIVEKLLMIAARRKRVRRRSKMKALRVGTWNVLSLYRSGALRKLMEILENIQLNKI